MGGVLSKLVPLMCNADRGLETESPAIGQFLEKIIVWTQFQRCLERFRVIWKN